MDNITIWFIGGNSVGKTTQAAMIHRAFRIACDQKDYQSVLYTDHKDGIVCKYTDVSPFTANLGHFNHPIVKRDGFKPNECSGTDNCSTKDQIRESYFKTLDKKEIIIVEGVMATFQWCEFLKKSSTNKLLLIHLGCSEDVNFARLRERRSKKKGIKPEDVVIDDKTKENLSGKLRGFKSLYNKAKEHSTVSLDFNTDKMSIKEIHEHIIKTLKQII